MLKAEIDLLLAHLPVPVEIIDGQNAKSVFCNQTFLSLLSISDQQQVMGRTLAELSPISQRNGADSESAFAEIINTINRDTSYEFDWTVQANDGALIEVVVFAQKLRYHDTEGILLVLQNITDTIESTNLLISAVQSANTTNEMRTKFVDEVSSALTAPISVIVEALNEALASATTNEQEELFNKAYYEAQNLLVLPQRLRQANEESENLFFAQ